MKSPESPTTVRPRRTSPQSRRPASVRTADPDLAARQTPPIAEVAAAVGELGNLDGQVTTAAELIPARRRRFLPRRPDVVAVGILLALTGAVSWNQLWRQHALADLDIMTFYLPWYSFLGQHLRHFDIPGWNPHQFIGTPFAGDPQSGWMYVPAMFFFALMPAVVAYQTFIIFHLVFAGLSAYVFARIIGMGAIAALVVATAFEFGPFVRHISCCTIHVQLATWIPLALIGVELALRVRSGTGRSLAWCLIGFAISQMLAGWIGQGAYNGLLTVGTYMAYRTLLSPPPGFRAAWRRRFLHLAVDGAAVLAIGFGLGAAGLLPRLDIVNRTNVAGGAYDGIAVSYYRGWYFPMLLARSISFDNGLYRYYLGGATLALVLLAPIVARRRFATSYFAGFTLVVLALTLKHTPVHAFFYLLPRYRVLHEHVPSRVLAVLWIGPAVLAGAAVQALPGWFRRPRSWWVAAVPIVAFGAAVSKVKSADEHVSWPTTVAVALVSLLLGAGALLSTARLRLRVPRLARLANLVPALLLALVLFDPTGLTLAWSLIDQRGSPIPAIVVPQDVATAAIPVNGGDTDLRGAGEFLQRQVGGGAPPFRYFGYDESLLHGGRGNPSTYRELFGLPEVQALLVNARAMRLGLYDVQGYNPVQLSQYVKYLRALNGKGQNYHDAQILSSGLFSPLLNILNARYIIIPSETPAGRPRPDLLALTATYREVFRNAEVRVLQNDDAYPRAWIVHNAQQVDPERSLAEVRAGTVDFRRTAILDTTPPALAQPTDPGADAVTYTTYEADRVALTTRTTAAGLVVLSEAYDPGWSAFVDGKPAPVYAADSILRAVAVPAGEHHVELRYAPRSLRLGVAISAVSSLVVVGMIGAAGWWHWTSGRIAPFAVPAEDNDVATDDPHA